MPSAFLTGALIGAGVALLFAPQPGTERRGKLRGYANRAKDDLVDKVKRHGISWWNGARNFMKRERRSSGMPDVQPKNLPNTHKTWPARSGIERRNVEKKRIV